jgi:hypothetical protein
VTTREELKSRLLGAIATQGSPSSDYDLNRDVVLPENRRLRAAAVLVPVALEPRGARLYLTMRSSRLKHHPGQVAFPGGKLDDGDDGPEAAALHIRDVLPTILVSEDAAEGVRSFLERRDGRFVGR